MNEVVLDRAGIQEIIPHRDPFPWVDEVTLRKGETTTGVAYHPEEILAVPGGDGRLWPKVLILEALTEVGAVDLLSRPEYRGKIAILTGFGKKGKLRPFTPGQPLVFETKLLRLRPNFGRAAGVVTSGGQLVVKTEVHFGIIDKPF